MERPSFHKKLLLGFVLVCAGCAHLGKSPERVEDFSAQDLIQSICNRPPDSASSVSLEKGSIWITLDSPELKGRFPAWVETGVQTQIVVTNLLGATEAQIKMNSNQLRVERPGHSAVQIEDHWQGIPLGWVRSLFQGFPPCPSVDSISEFTWSKQGETLLGIRKAQKNEEQYLYRVETLRGKLRLNTLQWTKTEPGRSIVVHLTPNEWVERKEGGWRYNKWEAQSGLGYVKVVWQQREM